mmetsp:Transcript_26635/g.37498  ORF Transcript_26635/g.37498 Transcript_26635/m.37498 type:complete len:104 (+) Transcript_26635:575-886(+)
MNTTKYSTEVEGVVIVFSTPTLFNTEKLNQYIEENLKQAQLQTTNEVLRKPYKRSKYDAATLNTNFVHFMDIVVPLLFQYEEELKHNTLNSSAHFHESLSTQQ